MFVWSFRERERERERERGVRDSNSYKMKDEG
jgi:hypothetical protein